MSATETYLLEVMAGRKGIVPSAIRATMALLAPVYCAGLEIYLLPYNVGARRRYRLDCPVICVGNLTTGGTGKTPMTQKLCRLLQAQHKQVAVLSRGYGGAQEYGCAVVSDGNTVLLTPAESGDEANLLAHTLENVPVVVGKDRRQTGKLAVERFHPDVVVLDDGMQYWQLHRDLDIVLLNAIAPFDNGWTFPRGLLREPPWHLKRAGVVVLTNASLAGKARLALAEKQVRRYAPHCPIFTADLVPMDLAGRAGEAPLPLDWLRNRRVAALSAIGNPGSFERLIELEGALLGARFRFRDHKAVTMEEMERVFRESCAANCEAILVTEKDAIKMAPGQGSLPIMVLRVEMRVDREAEFVTAVLSSLQGSSR